MIERRGTTMIMASSLAPQSTVEADRRERQEQLSNGRWTKVTATLRGEQLVVSSNGYKENDFNVTFDASENDRSLRVRRQIYSDRLTQPVVVDSFYDRTADVAQWNVDNQTTQTIQRAGIATAVGAIAGGGKGAAVGGIIGAAGGAGTVFIQGKRQPRAAGRHRTNNSCEWPLHCRAEEQSVKAETLNQKVDRQSAGFNFTAR
jgi:hypothetical protein